MSLPTIAIVGRPNVGKSTLFNRLTGHRQAVVWKERGTTRDRLYAPVTWGQATFRLIDTGGYDTEDRGALLAQVRRQVARAVEEAAVVLFVCDGQQGPTPTDATIAAWLRRSGKPVLLAVNKVDGAQTEASAADFFTLGCGAPTTVSATHGRGVSDLLDVLTAAVASSPAGTAEASPSVRLAIVGRPNVGKSTLVNQLVQDERAIVSAQPGTTRDALDTLLVWKETPVLLIDTAGLRHKARLKDPLDLFSRARTTDAIERSHAVVVVLDATAPVANDDQRVLRLVLDAGKGCVMVANKWDLVRGTTQEAFLKDWQTQLAFAAFVPIVCASAATGRFVPKVIDLALRVARRRTTRLQTAALNQCLHAAFRHHLPGIEGRTAIKFFYASQLESVPPTFVLFVNRPEHITRNYLQFLEGALRRRFELEGVPIHFQLRGRTAQPKSV